MQKQPQTRTEISLRDLLKTELVRRCEKNPSYSLRSFAKSLELSPAFVSKLLKGDRAFTEKTIHLLSEKLALAPDQVQRFKKNLKSKKWEAAAKDIGYRQIGLDQFQLISDWYHFAILELVTVRNFKSDPAWIAEQLGISSYQASDALDRLLRLNYLKKGPRGKVILVEENSTIVGPEIAVPATRKQQMQILEKSLEALSQIPIEQRSQSSSTMAIPSDRLDEAKEIITEFRRKMASVMQRPGERDSVYQLSISFFPLTINKKEKSHE